MIPKHLITTIFLTAIMGIFSAATAAKATFQTSSVGKWTGPELYIKQSSDLTPLQLHSVAISQPYTYRQGSAIEIHAKEDPTRKSSRTSLIATIDIPGHISQPLVVFVPNDQDNEEKPEKLRYLVLDLSTMVYSGGTLRFVNLSEDKLEVSLGDNAEKLKPNAVKVIEHRGDDPHKVAFNVTLLPSDEEATKVRDVGTMLLTRPTKRMTVFIDTTVNKRGKKLLTFLTLVDYLSQ